jgi:hypothetical protein
MTLVACDGSGETAVTDLTGWIEDQAALMGVLKQLHAMGLTLLSVERLKDDVEATMPRRGEELTDGARA